MIKYTRLILSKRRALIALLFLLTALLACNFPRLGASPDQREIDTTTQMETPKVKEWQRTVNRLVELQDQLEIPDPLLETGAVKSKDDFNPNEYFSILTHLTMEAGYELDYVYQYELMGGRPMVYARKDEKKPFRTAEDYTQAFP